MIDYYELLKAQNGIPISNKYVQMLGQSIADSTSIKTLTGRLPLLFRTSDTKLHDWELYGNNDVGKNLLEITAESQTINGVSFMIDKQAGTITANGIATGNLNMVIGSVYNSSNEPFNYYLSGGADDGSEQSYFIIGTTQVGARLKRWNGTTDMRGSLSLTDNVEMKIPANETGDIRVYIRNGANADNLVFKPMLRKANTSEAFEPYQIGVGKKTENGYVLNIGVGITPISSLPAATLITRKTINIGESPLAEGQTLSMSDFGDIDTQPYADMFIAAFEGFNYDDQLSYNQPEMRLKYKEYKE